MYLSLKYNGGYAIDLINNSVMVHIVNYILLSSFIQHKTSIYDSILPQLLQ